MVWLTFKLVQSQMFFCETPHYLMTFDGYPLVNCPITMERSTIFNGDSSTINGQFSIVFCMFTGGWLSLVFEGPSQFWMVQSQLIPQKSTNSSGWVGVASYRVPSLRTATQTCHQCHPSCSCGSHQSRAVCSYRRGTHFFRADYGHWGSLMAVLIPSGNFFIAIDNIPLIVDLPNLKMVIVHSYVGLPEAIFKCSLLI